MKQTPSSLILITVDCLRADHVGFLGYKRPTTPFLDSLADESLVFRNAITAGAPTYYSLPAILASRYPLALGRDVLGIAPEENTIPSVLKEYGFQTAAFSAANPYLSARFGYDQPFDCFRDFLHAETLEFPAEPPQPRFRSRANQALSNACHAVPGLGKAYDELYFRYCQRIGSEPCEGLDSLRRFPAADVIIDHASAWLKEHSSAPFFLWLHLMDPHAPYYPKAEALDEMKSGRVSAQEARYLNSFWIRDDIGPDRLRRKRDEVIALYDAGIRWADAQIRRLTEKLVELNVWDKCALAVTADHGEEFLEHVGRFHAPLKLTEELIRVPLLLRVPQIQNSCELSVPFGLIDLAPTLLDALGYPAPASFRGCSRWEQISRGEEWPQPVFTECVHGCTNPFHSENRVAPRILAIRKGHHKLVMDFSTGTQQLFNLSSDPTEQNPVDNSESRPIRRELLEHATKHLVESQKSRDFERRMESQLRDLRIEWAHSTANTN
jgi:arylsulfatase A-like enzyme